MAKLAWMNIIMIDSNAAIDYIWHNTDALKRLSLKATYYQFFLVYIEVMAGTHPQYKTKTENTLRYFSVLPFDSKAQTEAKQFARRYHAGKPIDLLIAAHARAEATSLLTNNSKDFTKFKGLKIIHCELPC